MRAWHWFLLISLLPGIAGAAQQAPQQVPAVREGMMFLLKGEKQKAWQLLFPEAQKGNVVAMYHLGVLMLQSPEYENHLARAKRFFVVAAEHGHSGSAAMLTQVNRMLESATRLPTIATTNGLPSQEQVARARAARDQFKAQVGRFVGDQPTIPPLVQVKAFFDANTTSVDGLVLIAEQAKKRFGDKVSFTYHLVVDQSTWTPKTQFRPDVAPASLAGLRPDLNGAEASKFGLKSFPGIVMLPSQGSPRLISNPNSLIQELSAALRTNP